MSEVLLSKVEWTREKEEAANKIGAAAIGLMEHRYGTGEDDNIGGHERSLPFHNRPHALMVGEQAAKLCVELGLNETEVKTARLAGFAHDVVQLQGAGTNEVRSAEWLEDQLDMYKIPELKEASTAAILGTEPLFTDGTLSHQVVHSYEGPNEQLVKAIPAADLSPLYTPQGPLESHHLYAEFQQKGPGQEAEVSLEGLVNFQRGQLALLEGYTYPLREAEELFATHRSEVMKHNEALLERAEQGGFDDFTQVLEADRQFFLRHQ